MYNVFMYSKRLSGAAFLFIVLLLSGCGQRQVVRQEIEPAEEKVQVAESPYDILAKNAPDVSARYIGAKYRFGANPDDTLLSYSDCSNLICAITRNSLSDSDYEFEPYYLSSDKIYDYTFEIEKEAVRSGDIIFFKDMKKKQNHLGLVTGRNEDVIYFIQASSASGVIQRSTKSNGWLYYWRDRFDSFRRWKDSVFATRKITANSRYTISNSK
ncbi:MAG: C40 family peptidase [Nitrospirae bacterium]|nr:C40 family peptidase [Nitrospirota bacterium]